MIARVLTAMISRGKKYLDADGNSFFRRIKIIIKTWLNLFLPKTNYEEVMQHIAILMRFIFKPQQHF